jgi:2-methylcitrate dehydratase
MPDTITATMARWAADLRYEDLGEQAIHEARRYLLDSLGCAFGGYRQEDALIALEVLAETGGSGPCTILGSGEKTDPVSASLANALMVRVMDYNDITTTSTGNKTPRTLRTSFRRHWPAANGLAGPARI